MPQTFKISDAHVQAFSQAQRKRFADEMTAYFHEHYPRESRRLGDDGLRKLIDDGVDRARTYHISAERDVARYLQFMVAIRRDFDVSHETPWAREILTNHGLLPPVKLERIAQRWTAEGPQE